MVKDALNNALIHIELFAHQRCRRPAKVVRSPGV
jgi:hypothetical protein